MIYGAGRILPRFFAPAVQNFIRDELSKQKAMAVSDEKDGKALMLLEMKHRKSSFRMLKPMERPLRMHRVKNM